MIRRFVALGPFGQRVVCFFLGAVLMTAYLLVRDRLERDA